MACPVCLTTQARYQQHPTKVATSVECLQCGDFVLTGPAAVVLKNEPENVRWKLSAWIRDQRPEGVTTHSLDQARATVIPNLLRRADRMLRWIGENFPGGTRFSYDSIGRWESSKSEPEGLAQSLTGEVVASPLISVGWNRNIDEVRYMLDEVLAAEMGLLKVSKSGSYYVVSAKGLLHLEGRGSETQTLGFCAMWFNQEVEPLWAVAILNAIREAGYEPLRIDAKQHNGKIDDEIVASIRSSRFVVADFTGQRGGVYYEAGFAMAWACQ